MRRADHLPSYVVNLLERWGLTPDPRATARLAPSRNLTVACRKGRQRFLVKTAAPGGGDAVDFETGLLPQLPPLCAGSPHAPRIAPLHAAAPGVVVLGWLPAVPPRRLGGTFELAVGRALATVHARSRAIRVGASRRVPGTLAHELVWTSPAAWAAFGAATATWWQRVQGDAPAMEALARLCLSEQREPQVLVHGDFRRANVLGGRTVAFVDWEQAGLGDAARDLGLWVADDVAAHLEGLMSRETMRARAGRLLTGYREVAGHERLDAGPRFLERVVTWMGEGLLRRVWTRSALEHRFSDVEAVLVEAACDVLHAPPEWARQLWGER